MTLLASSADFTYGNTRLRARRAARLSAGELLELAARDIDGVYGGLSATAYRPQVEAALARGGGTPRLHTAIRAHQAAELDELRSFYDGRARELVDLLLAGYDLHNLIALLRATLCGDDGDAASAEVVPIGAFSGAVVRELGRRHEPAALVALLAAWKLPDAETARATGRAYERFERDGDLARLEHEIAAAHAALVAGRLDGLGDPARALRAVVARRIDERNLFAGLRLRAAIDESPAATVTAPWLPGGTVPAAALDAAVRRPGAADAADALADALAGEPARLALAAWARDGDLVALERALDNRRLLDEMALYHRGDSLSVAIVVAACAELELEARNLRVLVEGAALDLGPEELRGRLLLGAR